MNRISQLFNNKKQNILNVYFTAGYPELDDTLVIMKSLQDSGADMIELGMPYSDPLADGPIIQHSSSVALGNGMTIRKLFAQLKSFRESIHLPVLLMGYMNPILQYGFDEFCREASASGIDGLIVPDLPIHEYEQEFGEIIRRHNLDFVFLLTPETTEMRIRKLDKLSNGFIYAVSSSSTTGKNTKLGDQEKYFRKLRELNLRNPILIGFGIRDRFTFHQACAFANGAIIGTAFIQQLDRARKESIPKITNEFIESLK